MSDKEVRIGINTDADTSGAKEAKASLDGVKKSADEVGKSTGVPEFDETLTEAEKSVEQLQKELAELAEAAEERHLERTAEGAGKLAENADQSAAELVKVNKELNAIKALQAADLVLQIAEGLDKMAETARDNELDGLGDSLEKSATAMRTLGTLGGVAANIGLVVTQLGGVKAAATAARGALAAVATAAAPIAAPILAAVAAGFAVKKVLESVARAQEREAQAAEARNRIYVKSNEERVKAEEELAEAVVLAMRDQEAALDRVLRKKNAVIAATRQEAREALATIDAEAAVESAEVDRQEAAGDITALEAAKLKAEIQRRVDKASFEQRRKLREAEVAEVEAAASVARDKQLAIEEELNRLQEQRKNSRVKFTEEELRDIERLTKELENGGRVTRGPRGEVRQSREAPERELRDIKQRANDRTETDSTKAIEALQKQLTEARAEANRLTEELDAVSRQTRSDDRIDRTRTGAAVTVSETRDRTREIAEERRKREEEADRRRDEEQAKIDAKARGIGGQLGGLAKNAQNAAPQAAATIRGIADQLSDGTDEEELQASVGQLKQAVEKYNETDTLGPLVSTLNELLQKQRTLEQSVKRIETRGF